MLPVVPGWGHLVLLRQLGLPADLLQRVVLQQGAVLKHLHQEVLRRRRRDSKEDASERNPSQTVTRRSVKTIRSPSPF
jgi:hypothetical protein